MHLDHIKGFMMRAGVGIWFSEDMRAHIQILREHCFFPSSPSAVVLHGIVMRLYFYFHFLLPFFFFSRVFKRDRERWYVGERSLKDSSILSV